MAFPAPAEIPNTSLPLPDPEAYPGEPREYARALMERKDELEREIETLRGVLSSHGSDASSSLIDPEGYPRGDIDVYSIRHARSALARLNTDIKTVTDLLPGALEAVFSTPLPTSSSSTTTTNQTPVQNLHLTRNGNGGQISTPSQNALQRLTSPTINGDRLPDIRASATPPRRRGPRLSDESRDQENWPSRPVARVNSVESGSPAQEAGLKAGDIIYMFERVTHAEGLREIGAVVRSGVSPLTLLIERDEARLALSLRPRVGWGGSGSLGCHIVPV